MKYAVIVEKCGTGFGAFVPDLPGCIATAATRDQVLARIRGAIECHIAGLREAGLPVPPPTSAGEQVDVGVP